MAQYSVAEAKNNLPKLIDRMLAGEEVTITRRGAPVANLTPARAIGRPLDLEWLESHQVVPASGADFDSAALIRQMRDEYRY
ncbi:MAG TPA: type II toxin-antitoxin system prevent-host-death family antitoxin [Caulobacteraceae bacterium]|jgi:prevent-host-death family protein